MEPKNIRSEAATTGILTTMFDITEAQDLKNTPGLKLYNDKAKGDEPKFQTYKEFGNTPISPQSISRVSITVEGADGKPEERFYKKIVQNAATGDDIDKVTNKTVDTDKDNKGMKAIAWIRTDESGKPLLTEGKAEIQLSFGGYKGNPRDLESQQAKYALAMEQGRLTASADKIPAFIDTVQAELKKQDITDYETHIGAHSMGSANAITAGAVGEAKGMNVKDSVLLDPVTASLAVTLLKKPDNAKRLGITEKQLDDTIAKTTSMRAVTFVKGEAALSNSAMLKVCDPETEQNEKKYKEMHSLNMGFLGNGLGGIASTGRDGNAPEKADPNNRMVGKELYIYVDKEKVTTENKIFSAAALGDPIHTTSHITYSLQKNTPIDDSIKELKAKSEAQKALPKQQEKQPLSSNTKAWNAEDIIKDALAFSASMAKEFSKQETPSIPSTLQNGLEGLIATIKTSPDKSGGRS